MGAGGPCSGSLHRLNVGELSLLGVGANLLEHLRLNVFRIHLAARPHALGELQTHVAGPRADVGHSHSRLEIEGVERAIWVFFLLALGPLQPHFAAAEAAHSGDMAAGERMDSWVGLKGLCIPQSGQQADEQK